MALEFAHLPDRDGPAVYLIGSSMTEERLKQLGTEIDNVTAEGVQVVFLDANAEEGASIVDFYDIEESSLPTVMIVMDDDTIYKLWSGEDLPAADMVAYEVGQITGSRAA